MPTPPTPIVAPGTAPDLTDSATFDARAYAWTIWERDHQVPETNALGANVYANAVETQNSAAAAAAAAALASAATGAAMFNAATNYAVGNVAISAVNFAAYRNTLGGVNATDPANDATGRWVTAEPGVTVITVAGNVTLTAGAKHRCTASCSPLLPAPANCVIGDTFIVRKTSLAYAVTVMRNGSTINGVADDALIDLANHDFVFTYLGGSAFDLG